MIVLLIVTALVLAVWIFMEQPKFGRTPTGARLARIQNSPNFREGKFKNIHNTPDLTEGVSLFKVLVDFIFGKSKRAAPRDVLPSKKTNLDDLAMDKNVLVWFGHSSYFIQVDGRRILVDPVFSGSASPLPHSVRSFKGADVYSIADIPEIDYLIISHDHWDHLDYETVAGLKLKIKKVITGLGTAEHLEYWGFDPALILEMDWYEKMILEEGFVVNALPARHFSGRTFNRQKSLWMSFALKTPTMNLFLGGDSGYDTHFAEIGNQFGPFDLAILECGQYHANWKYIHSMPDEVVREAQELKAKILMPVHWSKFVLGQHAWDEPIIEVTKFAKIAGLPVVTPMIGEEVNLKNPGNSSAWWVGIE